MDCGHPGGSGLASLSVVHQRGVVGGRRFLLATSSRGPFISRASVPPCFIVAGFDNVAIENQDLKDGIVWFSDPDYAKGS